MPAKQTLFFLLLLLSAGLSLSAQIRINEFMASNTKTYADQDGDYEDWIELYNAGQTDINLNGYYLTDNLNNLTKFRLTSANQSLVIRSKGYLVIWASGKHTRFENHVSWGLAAEGESIALVGANGTTLLDSFTFPAQRTDVSMGRRSESSSDWVWFSAPTPSVSNSTSVGYANFLSPPNFNRNGGFYNTPFQLTLSAPPGVTILYTLDGSEPSLQNTGGKTYTYKQQYPGTAGSSPGALLNDQIMTYVYSSPITIQDRSPSANRFSAMSTTFDNSPAAYLPSNTVKKATIVKAKAVREGYLESISQTHSFFGFSNPYTLPVFSMSTSAENLFGYQKGLYNAGVDFDNWRIANPGATPNGITPANYHRRGSEWEHLMSVEVFVPGTNQQVVATNAGFRGQGRYTRAAPQKSLRLYFREGYGSGTLNYPLFPGNSTDAYSRIVLRNWGNDKTDQFGLFRDAAVQRILRRLPVETQESQPVVTFLNGEYWGIVDAKNRYDTQFFEMKYGIPEADLELLERDAMINEGSSNTHYLDMRNFIRDQDMSQAGNYNYIQTQMDVENFTDYQLAQIYFANSDWPTNNVRYYRKKTSSYQPGAPKNHDGRWRWLFYDMDFALGNHSSEPHQNSLQRAIEHASPYASVILTNLLQNAEFKRNFIVRYADLMNVIFNAEQTNQSISYYEQLLTPEMQEYRARWPYAPTSVWDWNTHVNAMKNFADQRPQYARSHLKQQFSLGNEQRLNLTIVNAGDKAHLQVNTLHLKPEQPGIDQTVSAWSGLYYPEYAVSLTAHTLPGKKFVRWEGDVTGTQRTVQVTMTSTRNIRAIFEDETISQPTLLHYWHFNEVSTYQNGIPSDYDLQSLEPGSVSYAGKDGSIHTGEAGNMDGTNQTSGSTLNLEAGYVAGRALRPRNPSTAKELIIRLPSQGYHNLQLAYATHRTNNGAQQQRLFYTRNYTADSPQQRSTATEWTPLGNAIEVTEAFSLVSLNLPGGVAGSDAFAVKIQFEGSNAGLSEGNNRFDNFTFRGDYDASLPVRLVNFEVERNEGVAALSWVTTSETGLTHFEIQHSADGSNWRNAGEIVAQNRLETTSYHFQANLNEGLNYFRLRIPEKDGTSTYSEIRTIYYRAGKFSGPFIAPNPSTNKKVFLTGSKPGEQYDVKIISVSGTLVYEKTHASDTIIDLQNLPAGIYLFKLTGRDGSTTIRRVVLY